MGITGMGPDWSGEKLQAYRDLHEISQSLSEISLALRTLVEVQTHPLVTVKPAPDDRSWVKRVKPQPRVVRKGVLNG